MNQEGNIEVWKSIAQHSSSISTKLRKHMLDFCHNIDKTSKELAVMDLVRRVECNLKAVMSLSILAMKSNGSVYFKLPIGLLLRSCFTDCLMGLYLQQLSEDGVQKMLDDLSKEYTKSLFERFEVYKDKVSIPFDDEFFQTLYIGQLEDHFLDYLTINEKYKSGSDHPFYQMWSVQQFERHQTSKIKKSLATNSSYAPLVNRLYGYFKYFSQYEHFSGPGHGDTLADFGEDNVSFPKALDSLAEATSIMATVYAN